MSCTAWGTMTDPLTLKVEQLRALTAPELVVTRGAGQADGVRRRAHQWRCAWETKWSDA